MSQKWLRADKRERQEGTGKDEGEDPEWNGWTE